MAVSLLPEGSVETAFFQRGLGPQGVLALKFFSHELLFFLFLVGVDFDVAFDG